MRYVFGLLVVLGLIVLLIILLVSGGKKPAPAVHQKSLVDYASTDAQVSMTIDGPVGADSEHEQIRVTVDSANVTFEHLTGYPGDVDATKLFANNQDAYDVFLHALALAGFTQGDDNPALRDERGWCAAGDRYIFEITQNGKTLERFWNTSCGNTKTYLGNTGFTLTLFQAQVPGYNALVENTRLQDR